MPRFIKYTGYGNAAGLLAARGLMAGGRPEGQYSEDEDTDTEEYKEAKARCVCALGLPYPLGLGLSPGDPGPGVHTLAENRGRGGLGDQPEGGAA